MSTFMIDNKPMYSSMVNAVKNGEIFTIGDMTPEKIEQLWADEMVADAEIAMLFNTSAGMVHSYRQAHGITRAARMRAGAEAMSGILGGLGSYIMQLSVATN